MDTDSTWTPAHLSVMANESAALLVSRPSPGTGRVYCDVTLGAGGHAALFLQHLGPQDRLIGVDRDATALALAHERLRRFGPRFVAIHGAFADLPRHLAGLGIEQVDGLFADLGVSSMQLDTASRGFSFQNRGPLDMRMDPSMGESALELLQRLEEGRLAQVLAEYGEERHARRIARAIKVAVTEGTLNDTLALAEVVRRASPIVERHKHPATRTFQALRIAVNDELRQVHLLTQHAQTLLRHGGRFVVLTFHSLEDRLVKHAMRGPGWSLLTKRPQTCTEEELATNPRARSAHLRAAVRAETGAEASPSDEFTTEARA